MVLFIFEGEEVEEGFGFWQSLEIDQGSFWDCLSPAWAAVTKYQTRWLNNRYLLLALLEAGKSKKVKPLPGLQMAAFLQ